MRTIETSEALTLEALESVSGGAYNTAGWNGPAGEAMLDVWTRKAAPFVWPLKFNFTKPRQG